jgi:RNase P subunit RPR2
MKCPECKTLFTKENVRCYVDKEDDFIEIEVECKKCDKTFFSRIHEEDLILAY